jgi:hypothetical protein
MFTQAVPSYLFIIVMSTQAVPFHLFAIVSLVLVDGLVPGG